MFPVNDYATARVCAGAIYVACFLCFSILDNFPVAECWMSQYSTNTAPLCSKPTSIYEVPVIAFTYVCWEWRGGMGA